VPGAARLRLSQRLKDAHDRRMSHNLTSNPVVSVNNAPTYREQTLMAAAPNGATALFV
jgi:hypothetical protein